MDAEDGEQREWKEKVRFAANERDSDRSVVGFLDEHAVVAQLE